MRLRFQYASLLLAAVSFSNLMADDDLFRSRVAPIFATHCLSCHNHSDAKGGFSIEDAESFFDADVVEPGNAADSILVQQIIAENGQRAAMPKTGPTLTREQSDVIRQWVNSGAKWPDQFVVRAEKKLAFDWWSLKKLQTPSVPGFDDQRSADNGVDDWVRNPIDAFVLQELNEQGLSPSPPADRRTLIRRLSYDLTGLPPTFQQIHAFENDTDPDAYQRLVDRLLGSPRYGEHWARHWLDVVKYADTCGYDKDKLRVNAWPYRDYVIRSFNEDKPYRQFVQEQIAGDVLYPGTPDGILGLGFVAAGPWDFIGHVEVPESKIDGQVARNLDRDDMVSNTMNTFCSVTIQCARCHDHKFDPINQGQYYGMQTVFAAVDRADRVYDTDPEVTRKRESLQQQISRLMDQLASIDTSIDVAGGQELKDIDGQIQQARQSQKRPEFGYHSNIAALAEVEKWVEVEFSQAKQFTEIILRPCHDDFAEIGAGFGFPPRFRVEVDGRVVFDQTRDDRPNPKLQAVSIPAVETATRVRIVATKLAPRRNDFIFALAELQILNKEGTNIALHAKVNSLDSIEAPERWQATNLVDGIWFETESNTLAELNVQRTQLIRHLLGDGILQRQSAVREQLAEAQSGLEELPPGKMVYAATTRFPSEGNFKPTEGNPRVIRLLSRGDVRSPGQVVEPGVLPLSASDDWLMDLDQRATEADRRAALAQWLTRDDNPLTWRSIVNRVWHYHFGRGIVDTPNDFGRMGSRPSHADLLDWLAIEFRDNGGSLKELHRLIVNSSVYRQSSTFSPVASEKDSGNRWLWRMNRRRLSAEEIRDSILQVSGVLNRKMGGPGFYLFELSKTEHSPHYEYHNFDHTDEDSFRRSIYRFIVRSQPDPYMTTLDCADSSQSTPARLETQTPLQSLTMLNSRFNLVMAEKFADRLRRDADSTDRQIRLAIQRALGRDPTAEELELMRQYVAQHGLANLTRIIFNMSEFVYVD